MSRSKSTRGSTIKVESDIKPKARAPAVLKVFYISENLIDEESNELSLEKFYHPGKNKQALFITQADKHIMEVLEFNEPRRSWLINNDVCSNGRIYITTPFDVTFLALHYIRKHCDRRAVEIETINEEKDASVSRLFGKFVSPHLLKCVADVKSAGDLTFYKYNQEKTLAWLTLKTKRLADSLKLSGIYCGRSAVSKNYIRSEKAEEGLVQYNDYLRVACDIVGGYLDLDLQETLSQHLNIPQENKASDETDDGKKRKSLTTLTAAKNKKPKIEEDCTDAEELKNKSLFEKSSDADDTENDNKPKVVSPIVPKLTPLKERVLSAKEKALAKGAKGTKSISSFFKK